MATITSLGFSIRSSWNGSGVREAREDLAKLQEDMRRISGATLSVQVVVDTDGIQRAKGEINSLREDMKRLNNSAILIQVRVDGNEQISAARERIRQLNIAAGDISISFDLNEASYITTDARIEFLTRRRVIELDFDANGLSNDILRINQTLNQTARQAEDYGVRTSRAMIWVRIALIGVFAAAAAIPVVINLIGTALVALPGLISVGLGGFFLSKIEAVSNAFEDLKEKAISIGTEAVQPMVGPVIEAFGRLTDWMERMKGQFRTTFEGAAQLVRPLTDTLTRFIESALPGFNSALANSLPLFNGLQEGVKNFGLSLGNSFQILGTQSKAFGMTLNQIFTYTGAFIESIAGSAARSAVDVNFVMGEVMTSFMMGFDGFLEGAEGFIAALADVPTGMTLIASLGDVMREVLPPLGQLYATISGALGPALQNLAGPIGKLIGDIALALVPAVEALTPILLAASRGIAQMLEAMGPSAGIIGAVAVGLKILFAVMRMNPIGLIVTGVVLLAGYLVDLERRTGKVSETWNRVWAVIGPTVQPVVDTVRNGVQNIIDTFNRLGGVSGIIDGLKSKFGELRQSFNDGGGFTAVGQKIADAFGPITDIVNAFYQGILPQLQEIGTKFMDAFRPVWERIKPGIMELGNALKDMWTQVQPVLIALGAVIGTVLGATLFGILGAFGSSLAGLANIGVAAFNALTGVITGIANVIGGFAQTARGAFGVVTSIVKIFAGIFTGNGEAIGNAWNKLGRGLRDVMNGIGEMFTGVWQIITSIVSGIVRVFMGMVQTVWGVVSGFVMGVIDFFTHLWDVLVGHSIVPDMINAIIKWFLELPGKLLKMVADFVMSIVNYFVDLAGRVIAQWQAWIDRVMAIYDGFKAALSAAWNAFWDAVRQYIYQVVDAIRDRWQVFFDRIRAIYDGFKSALSAAWNAFWDAVRQYIYQVVDAIRDRWTGFLDAIKSFLSGFIDNVKSMWSNFWDSFGDKAKAVWDYTKSEFERYKNNIIDTVQSIVDRVKGIWDNIVNVFQHPIDAVKGIWNGVAGAFGLPQLAIGGPAEGPINRATGGGVDGYGTGTSDDIPAMLSRGEHVWTAREVDAAGGHDAVLRIRQETLQGGARIGLAAGGPALGWMAGQAAVHAPALQLTSGVRSGDPGYHGRGQAADFSNGGDGGSPEMQAFARWIANTWGRQTLELIHSPFNSNIKDGRDVGNGMGLYGAGTMSGHRNHVHWAVPNALDDSAMGSAIAGGGSITSGPSPEQMAKAEAAKDSIKLVLRDSQRAALAELSNAQIQYAARGVGSRIETPSLSDDYLKNAEALSATGNARVVAAAGTVKQGVGAMDKIEAAMMAMTNVSGVGGDIGGVIPDGDRMAIIERAMQITGTPPPSTREAWLRGMNTLISRESGWNAGARNDWDSNAAKGQNSVGLAQVIPGTFASNKAAGYDNIYGAVDNVAASINYIKRSYGTIENVQQANANMSPKGYATGTGSAATGWAMVGENGPEMVNFRGGETVKTFEQVISALKNSASGTGTELQSKLSADFNTSATRIVEATKAGNADLRTVIATEIRSMVNQMSADTRASGNQLSVAIEDAIERVLATAGMKIDISAAGGNIDQIIAQVQQQLVPKLEMLVRQRVGAKA